MIVCLFAFRRLARTAFIKRRGAFLIFMCISLTMDLLWLVYWFYTLWRELSRYGNQCFHHQLQFMDGWRTLYFIMGVKFKKNVLNFPGFPSRLERTFPEISKAKLSIYVRFRKSTFRCIFWFGGRFSFFYQRWTFSVHLIKNSPKYFLIPKFVLKNDFWVNYRYFLKKNT